MLIQKRRRTTTEIIRGNNDRDETIIKRKNKSPRIIRQISTFLSESTTRVSLTMFVVRKRPSRRRCLEVRTLVRIKVDRFRRLRVYFPG